VTDSVELAQITINRLGAMVRLTGDLVRGQSLSVTLCNDDSLVGQTASHVVQRSPAWNHFLLFAFVGCQLLSNAFIMSVQKFGKIAVRQ
jgi:hypothetical protein